MKNLLLILIVLLFLTSCGKKADPEYKVNNIIQSQKIFI
tara:strand:- start:2202 stop:2318 length:117 start_codon:yes stop_codon:yes gene_type:complete